MTLPLNGLTELQEAYPNAMVLSDGGVAFVSIPDLQFTTGGGVTSVNALLCPQSHSGYTTRLFLERSFPSSGQNWTAHTILNRTWWSWSWNNIQENQPLLTILAGHLRAII
jgi:hypothetical protein